jgi:hypothetical protein
MTKILEATKACADPQLWGSPDIYAPSVLNGVGDFMDSTAFHLEAVAFYAMA